MSTTQQPANVLPVHPALAALNLPPLPWAGHGPFFEVFAADDWEVAYVPQKPSHVTDVTRYAYNTTERRAAIGRVIAAGPDAVNVIAHFCDWVRGKFDGDQYEALVTDALAVLARATGQEGGATA